MTFDEAENFCQVKVRFPSRECRNPLRSCCRVQTGGHLYSIHDQRDYDKLKAASVGYNKPIMIGLRSDSAGNWEWTDVSASVPFAAGDVSQEVAAQGSPVDLSWLRAHSDDGLQGLGENKG